MEFKDYLGNKIEVGDTILVPRFSDLLEYQVIKITNNSIVVPAIKYKMVDFRMQPFNIVKYLKHSNQFINLSKIQPKHD